MTMPEQPEPSAPQGAPSDPPTPSGGRDLAQADLAVLRALMSSMSAMVVIIDHDDRISSINGAVTRLLGYDQESLVGANYMDVLDPDDRERILSIAREVTPDMPVQLDARLVCADGSTVLCDVTVADSKADPLVSGFVVTAQLSPALADARARITFLAQHDELTGLLNRSGFGEAASVLTEDGPGLGVLLVDIERFRALNELYGVAAGDEVLVEVASRLDRIRMPRTATARLSADEFAIAVGGATAATMEELRAEVMRVLGLPIRLGLDEVVITMTTVVVCDDDATLLPPVLAAAATEMTAAKRALDTEPHGVVRTSLDERRRQLEQLRAALADGSIRPFFQPIVRADGTIVAVEALARWLSPRRAERGVEEIFPIAHLAGLADAVDDQVLESSLELACKLTESEHGHIKVHVNVPPRLLAQQSFAFSFLSRCEAIGASPDQLVIEITETDLLAPDAASLDNLDRLRGAGTRVSIDDFGTGYSSLAHLLELPVDGVKIDQRFVAGLDVDPAATNLTTAIVSLSKSLRLDCVAEGVEQPYQAQRLVELGCSTFQGWLFARAVPAEEVLAMLPRIDQASQRVPL
jgi:diguanylate cyclase (GGDEF)-like protein/PAS domain S-box-containing protein